MAPRTTLLETIANGFLARREELAEEMTERIRAGVAEFADFDGPELWEAVRASCLANIEAGLSESPKSRPHLRRKWRRILGSNSIGSARR